MDATFPGRTAGNIVYLKLCGSQAGHHELQNQLVFYCDGREGVTVMTSAVVCKLSIASSTCSSEFMNRSSFPESPSSPLSQVHHQALHGVCIIH